MNVLMISDLHTHPQNMGNRQRVYSICMMMKKLGWNIDFLYFGRKKDCDWTAMRNFFGRENLFFADRGEYTLKSNIKAHFRKKIDAGDISKMFPLKYVEDEWYCADVDKAIYLLTRKKEYDMVWMPYLFQSRSLELFPHILKVIESQDRFGNRDRIFRKLGKKPEFFYTTNDGERKALSRADVVVTIQKKEEETFKKMLSETNTFVCNIGNVIEFRKTRLPKEKNFGFIGTSNGPNLIGFQWFVEEVLPLVRAKMPDFNFFVAGALCNKISDSTEYVKLGYVDSLQDFYDSIRFSIVPMLNGTGLNIKSIEALAYSKPLVSTTVGAKGLENAKEAMLITDSSEKMAERIVELLQDDKQCQNMMEAAEQFVRTYNLESEKKLLEIGELAKKRKDK